MPALIDTSFLLATVSQRDTYHEAAREALRILKTQQQLVAPVLPEIFYMTMVRVGYDEAVNLLYRITTSGVVIIDLTSDDYVRMDQIMRGYRDAYFDFVDVAQMAVCERLNIRQIYTFDRRDFAQFRPHHCDYLDLLP
jgi:predicted nucleic acid-binding protein